MHSDREKVQLVLTLPTPTKTGHSDKILVAPTKLSEPDVGCRTLLSDRFSKNSFLSAVGCRMSVVGRSMNQAQESAVVYVSERQNSTNLHFFEYIENRRKIIQNVTFKWRI
jgi:hypothetical protein